jgi:hypothetical protein
MSAEQPGDIFEAIGVSPQQLFDRMIELHGPLTGAVDEPQWTGNAMKILTAAAEAIYLYKHPDIARKRTEEEQPLVARLTTKFKKVSLVILTKEPDDSARQWLREKANNEEDKFTDPHRLLEALKQCEIKPEPTDREDVAVDRIWLAIGADAFQARFRSPDYASPEEAMPATSASLKEVQDKIRQQFQTQLDNLEARRSQISDEDYKASKKMIQRRLDTALANGQLEWEARQTPERAAAPAQPEAPAVPAAAKAEIGERESWAEYWDQHKSTPSIYLITVEQLETFLERRRSRRAQQRQRERETEKKPFDS